MANPAALLLLGALAGGLHSPPAAPCEYETNRIKDLLQASCEERGLAEVPPGLAQGTGILLLASNRLARVSTASLATLRNLTDLDLSRNGLRELEAPSPLPGLQELDLSRNSLTQLPPLRGFPGLLRLALGHNALSGLPAGAFLGLDRLVDLELQGNQLGGLPEDAFAGLAALKDLDLSDNRLALLPAELLAGLGALETLRLERNRLQAVPEGFFPEGHLFAYVYLAGNPWRCDCALDYLRGWILENEFSVYTRAQGPGKEITENQPENVTCHDPPEERGRPVMAFSLECRPESERGARGDEQGGGGAPQTDPSPHPGALSAPPFPATPTAFFTQPEPSTSDHGPSPRAPSQATPLPPSTPPAAPSPSTPQGSTPAPSPWELSPVPTTAPAAPQAPATPSPRAWPAPATLAHRSPAHPPGPPPPTPTARCQCPPALPGPALGLTSRKPWPVSWGAWRGALCCPLRLGLYVACLGLLSLATLAGLWGGTGPGEPRGRPGVLAPQLVHYQRLQNVAPERCHVAGEGDRPLPGPRLYRACKRLEIGPLRHVTWLLVSLPGPSGQWPWERRGHFPSYSLDRGKDSLGAVRVKYATATL